MGTGVENVVGGDVADEVLYHARLARDPRSARETEGVEAGEEVRRQTNSAHVPPCNKLA